MSLIEIDGSMMEGGGQILRIAVTYSAILGIPIRVHNIRMGRSSPGLKPQHLTTLRAVAAMCDAEVYGLKMGSVAIEFFPKAISGGSFEFDIRTAGSISLLLQCIAPVAHFAESPVKIRVKGGTAVRWSPPVRILDRVVWRALRHMGFHGDVTLIREGFYPQGGGIVDVTIHPLRQIFPINSVEIGEVEVIKGFSICGELPQHVAERQVTAAREVLEDAGYSADISSSRSLGRASPISPGSVIGLWVLSKPETFIGSSALGEKGKPAERVGKEASFSLLGQLSTGATVDKYTADSLVLWCSLAKGPSSYSMSELTLHTETAVELAKIFTKSEFDLSNRPRCGALLRCSGVEGN
jgi:RNA 3'-terminal phosphate cyclase (ATP)